MHSSTSSSSIVVPPAPYAVSWGLTALILAGLLAGSEVLWRGRGFAPSVRDSEMLWCVHRQRVYSEEGRRKIVVLGASRAQDDIVPEALAQAFPEYAGVVHLAVEGHGALPLIKALLQDPDFDGLVIADVTTGLLDSSYDKANPVGRYEEQCLGSLGFWSTFNGQFNAWTEAELQSRIALLSPALTLKNLIDQRLSPTPPYWQTEASRYRPAWFRSGQPPEKLADLRRWRIGMSLSDDTPLDPPDQVIRRISEELGPLFQSFTERGGQVVLVRLPSTAEHWERDERLEPKALYWDRVESAVHVPTIHFRDYPELLSFDCPDTSHLDAEDAPEFTRRLAAVVRQRLGLYSTMSSPGAAVDRTSPR